jgi:drug/metabolite transporter (DMT)-like permease
MSTRNPAPLFQLSPRDLLILVITALFGIGAGYLLANAMVPIGQAVLGSFAAAGTAFVLFDKITTKR